MDEVHFEILLGTGFPTAWIITIEPRKGNFSEVCHWDYTSNWDRVGSGLCDYDLVDG